MKIFKRKVDKSSAEILSNFLTLSVLDERSVDLHFKKVIARTPNSNLRAKISPLLQKSKIINSLNQSQRRFDTIGRFPYWNPRAADEKIWIVYEGIIRQFRGSIVSFISTRTLVANAMLLGDFENALDSINKFIELEGESLWSLRAKSQILVELGRLSDANEIFQSAHRRCESKILKIVIGRMQSLTVASDTNYALISTILPLVQEFEAAGSHSFAALFSGLFLPYSFRQNMELSDALYILQLLPAIDLYDFLSCILMEASIDEHLASGEYAKNFSQLIKNFASIADDELLMAASTSSRDRDFRRSEAGGRLLDEYESGNYAKAIKIFNSEKQQLENIIGYVNVIGKSKAYLKSIGPEGGGNPISKLIDFTAQMYSLDQNAIIADEAISAMSVRLNFLRKSASIQLCAIKCAIPSHRKSGLGRKIARLSKIENIEVTPLTESLSTEKNLIPYGTSDGANDRNLRLNAQLAMQSGDGEHVIEALVQKISIGHCLEKDYLELFADFCVKFDRLEELIDFAAKHLCLNPITVSCFPMDALVDCIEEKNVGSISSSIVAYNYVKHIDDSKDIILNESFEAFLENQSVRRPSELLQSKRALSAMEVVFFRDICVIGTMDCLSCFKSGDDLKAERIKILDCLIDIGCVEPGYRRREFEELINQSIFEAAAHKMDGAKIYVDEAGIKRKVREDVDKLLLLYKSISDDEPPVEELIELESFDEENSKEEAGEELKRAIVMNAKSAAAIKIWSVVKKEFIHDEKYGLEKNLSAEIRHGFFSNLIRSKLEERKLLVERDEHGKYRASLSLRDTNPLVLPRVWEEIDAAFANFSQSINSTIDLAESWMQVRGETGGDGIHLYMTNVKLAELTRLAQLGADSNQIIDKVLDLIWSNIDFALHEIRSKLNVEFREKIVNAFTQLEVDFGCAKGNLPFLDVSENIRIAQAEFLSDVATASGWFCRAAHNNLPAGSVDSLINVAIQAFERVNALGHNASFERYGSAHIVIQKESTRPFVIALINIFDNCLMHSGFSRATKIKIDCTSNETQTIIEVTNKLSEERLSLFDETVIAALNSSARNEQNAIMTRSEGGSGTVKAYREIVNNFPKSDVEFLLRQDDFVARITYVH
ncbi:MAG: hypothetical protein IV104_13955 [Acidovorax sp.]|nr:hypothetical protein [Acidovorax sp.]